MSVVRLHIGIPDYANPSFKYEKVCVCVELSARDYVMRANEYSAVGLNSRPEPGMLYPTLPACASGGFF